MNKNNIVIILCLVLLVQLAVPAYMIMNREGILRNGIQLKFKTQPVDPYDAFRGKYVAISIEGTTGLSCTDSIKKGQRVYAVVKNGEDGFSTFEKVTTAIPLNCIYIEVKSDYTYNAVETVNIVLPFDRYYMNESLAPKAEEAYREHSAKNSKLLDTYVTVRVKNGKAVLEELFIANLPIKEFLKK